MIKKGDVVLDYKRRILHVEGTFEEGAETFVVGRIYLSQKRVAVPMSSVRRHKFLNS
jgi:hypothetical protein